MKKRHTFDVPRKRTRLMVHLDVLEPNGSISGKIRSTISIYGKIYSSGSIYEKYRFIDSTYVKIQPIGYNAN